MTSFRESTIEFANFNFERQKVVCYGLKNHSGGATTVFNFPTLALASKFRQNFLQNRDFETIQNAAQIICLADYDRVMRRSDNDPRVRCLHYNREFMMGTLAHAT